LIDYERDGAIGHLTLNRPEKLNALNEDAWRELPAILEEADRERAVKVLVIAGAGRCFSAGADIGTFAKLENETEVYRFISAINAAMRALEEFSKPVIAAVHGYAYGGGCELTMMSDIVVADETARFALPEIKSGIMPGPGLVRGPSHASLHVLKYLALTGEPLPAEEALRCGLVNRLVKPGEHRAEADRLAGIVSQHSSVALSEAKRYLNAQVPSQFDYVTASLSFLFGTQEAHRGASKY
jgi:enoyl-CoA hydratase/carnithine racemase